MRLTTFITGRSNVAGLVACLALSCTFAIAGLAQDEVTGSFEGKVVNARTNDPLKDATVRITNKLSGIPYVRRTDKEGKFLLRFLSPGIYTIRISAEGFKTVEVEQRLFATQAVKVIPYPTMLEPEEKKP